MTVLQTEHDINMPPRLKPGLSSQGPSGRQCSPRSMRLRALPTLSALPAFRSFASLSALPAFPALSALCERSKATFVAEILCFRKKEVIFSGYVDL